LGLVIWVWWFVFIYFLFDYYYIKNIDIGLMLNIAKKKRKEKIKRPRIKIGEKYSPSLVPAFFIQYIFGKICLQIIIHFDPNFHLFCV
jgi:hypothetical protein